MDLLIKNNINSLVDKNRGWVVGHFADVSTPFHNENFEVKWVKDKRGRIKENLTSAENTQTTLVILVYGKMLLEIINEGKKEVIDQEGDYILYKPTVPHRTTFLEDSHIIVIRWE